MEITEVRINPSKGGRVRAFASIVIDDCFIINDLRVMEGREGQLFVTMPARKIRNGQMRDIAHPLTSAARRSIEDKVLAEFRIATENLIVMERSQKSGRKESLSPLARLASRLFSEDYWTGEQPRKREKSGKGGGRLARSMQEAGEGAGEQE
jgi:stage V sporulation protein G